MERHRCKLCFRNFANGRALGGHMRSHMMNLYAPRKASKMKEDEEENHQQPFDHDIQSVHSNSSTSAPSSSFSEEEEEEGEKGLFPGYGSGENPKRSALLMDSVVVQDRESETESSKNNPIRRRSKRVRKTRVLDPNRFFSMNDSSRVKKPKFNPDEFEPEPLSSISESSPEEDVAHCLIMLSKDKWEREETEKFHVEKEKDVEMKFEDGFSEDSDMEKEIKANHYNNKTNKVRGKYRCETCDKSFKSYQALGGHRASHKKITKVNTGEEAAPPPSSGTVEEKIHECPFCQRVFSSGQALGGHKRSHFLGGGGISANASPVIIDNNNNIINNNCGNNNIPLKMEKVSRIGEGLNIDLNLPAPIDEDDEIAISAVSDGEFVHPIKQ